MASPSTYSPDSPDTSYSDDDSGPCEPPRRVTIVGYGNWGSAIARIVGKTAVENPLFFDRTIRMWVSDEMVNDRKLSEIINTDHENVKYLPGTKLPDNVVAVPDLVDSCRDANVLIFVVPQEFVAGLCKQLKGNLVTDVQAISLVQGICNKICGHSPGDTNQHNHGADDACSEVAALIQGLSMQKQGGIKLISEEIRELLGIEECHVLTGANLASAVANDNFCEATICGEHESSKLLKKLFHTENMRIVITQDKDVEAFVALTSVVACAAGFTDGLGYGASTKAAVIRLGLMETIKILDRYFPGSDLTTYCTETGSVADLITTCYGGENRKVCEAVVKTNRTLVEVEKELLGGQSAQGPLTAEEVFLTLEKEGRVTQFPLFVAVHRICKGETAPEQLIDCLRNHPEHMEI